MSKFEHYIDVRYYETDQMGIVHHSNYIRYFECGRMAMLKEVGLPMHKIEEA
jgi:acyl-CoA thioester hydrolase